mmetsp:Transcript_6928/g.12298  ORF Transcript_6928/g.12298 Transcript_6928/m.12298 type:complete len:233 (-) Transcript_6928:368-1066(-)
MPEALWWQRLVPHNEGRNATSCDIDQAANCDPLPQQVDAALHRIYRRLLLVGRNVLRVLLQALCNEAHLCVHASACHESEARSRHARSGLVEHVCWEGRLRIHRLQALRDLLRLTCEGGLVALDVNAFYDLHVCWNDITNTDLNDITWYNALHWNRHHRSITLHHCRSSCHSFKSSTCVLAGVLTQCIEYAHYAHQAHQEGALGGIPSRVADDCSTRREQEDEIKHLQSQNV